MSAVLFRDVRIFDGTGTAPYAGEVLVRDQSIAAVTPRAAGARAGNGSAHPTAPDVRIIDASGATLMPGLVEPHAHLSWPSSIGNIINAMQLPAEEHLLITAYNARVTLDHGYTSAYSAGSLGQRFEVALRDQINAGHLPGPRLRASSIENAPVGVPGVPAAQDGAHARGVEGLRSYVQQMARLGVDTIKILLSSDEGFAPGGAQMLLYTEAEVAAIGETARAERVWLACHAQAAEAVKMAVRHGFRLINHCTYADTEALDQLEANKDRVFVAPAPGLLYARVHEAAEFGIDRAAAERLGAVSGLELMQRIYPEMRRRGIRVLPGGDSGFPYNPIGRNARDLQLFVDLFGYQPAEVLTAATKLGGELMDLPVGQIRPGFLADLLLIDGDPLQDLRILQDKDRLLAIMQGGRFHKPPTRPT
jgi:imidazolonepropionase-like amidohydrolase